MMNKIIEFRNDIDTGDWFELLVAGKVVADGHSPSYSDWAKAIKEAGGRIVVVDGSFDSNGSGEWTPNDQL